jgi:hypothetical protein
MAYLMTVIYFGTQLIAPIIVGRYGTLLAIFFSIDPNKMETMLQEGVFLSK